jgi:hypothetical protein
VPSPHNADFCGPPSKIAGKKRVKSRSRADRAAVMFPPRNLNQSAISGVIALWRDRGDDWRDGSEQQFLVAERHFLSDLSALVSGFQCRRGRRPRRHHRTRLPYLKALGIDAIWLSPVFPSPMADFGYDISDYTGIDPLFGTMEDFDALVSAAHEAASRSSSIWCRTTPPTSIPGSSKREARAIIRSATGISGAIRSPTAAAEQLAVGIRRQRLDAR